MTDVVADLHAGVLKLSRSRLMDLAAIAAGHAESVDEQSRDALEAAGLVSDGRPHPDVELVALTVFEPLARLRLELADSTQRVFAVGWIGPELSILAVPAADGLDEIKACPTGFLAARLAGYLGLGPRPRRSGSVLVQRRALDAGDATSGSAILDQIRAELRLRWRVDIAWSGGRRSLEVLDAGHQGLWTVDEEKDLLRIEPAAATDVWLRLLRLLPQAQELDLGSPPLG